MTEKDKLMQKYEQTQKEWEGLSLEWKKDKVISCLQAQFDSTDNEDIKLECGNVIFAIDISPDEEASELVEKIHSEIMANALEIANRM